MTAGPDRAVPRTRRARWCLAAVCGTAAALVALTLSGCGDSPTRSARAAVGTVTVPGTAGTLTRLVSPPASQTTTARGGRAHVRISQLGHLNGVLTRSADGLGAHVGLEVVDLSTGQILDSHAAGTPRAPASLEKLYTSAAMLLRLGPQGRLSTTISGVGYLKDGIWHGNLYLRGGGDPTFGDGAWNTNFDGGYGPTAGELLSDLRAAGLKGVDGLLYADASRFDSAEGGPATGDAPDVSDYGGELSALVYDHGMTSGNLGPAQSTVHEVALTARLQGFHLVASTRLAATPPGATTLATLQSPPLEVMLRLMLVPSDDLFADLFAKQLGFLTYGDGTLSLGAEAIAQLIARHYGLHPVILDGSGLDKSDRSSPADFISLLRQVSGTPVGDVIRADLPVVGVNGTVQGIGLKTPAAHHCQAKTGTLNNVTNLAGYCETASGQLMAFAFMADGPSNGQALAAFSPMVGAVAGY